VGVFCNFLSHHTPFILGNNIVAFQNDDQRIKGKEKRTQSDLFERATKIWREKRRREK
jgi:hypothetical protein